MDNCTLVVLGAGSSSRFELQVKKQWLRVGDEPLWLNTANRLNRYSDFDKVIVVGHKDELNYMKNFSEEFIYVAGGDSRQESMSNALNIVDSKYVMVTDVARSCVPEDVLGRLFNACDEADCIVPILNVSDTVIYNDDTINRDDVKLVQTPQLSKTQILKDALQTSQEFTDDSSVIKQNGGTVYYVQGSIKSSKLTFGKELDNIDCIKPPSRDTFVGFGYDIHPFENGKQMVLGGIEIDSPIGFKAHSDGDVLIHSLIDAILGSIGAGDIGEFFPDTDAKYKNADSKVMLKDIMSFITNVGYKLINIDITIVAEVPKINPHKDAIKTMIAALVKLPKNKINIKATTSERLGFIGRSEGVAVQSVVSTQYYNWRNNS